MRKLVHLLPALLVVLCFTPAQAADWQFKVERISAAWKDHVGALIIDGDGIEYKPAEGKQASHWKFGQIQQLKVELQRIEILTFEDQKWRLGKDRVFRFKLLESSIDAEVSDFLRHRISGVFVTAIVPKSSDGPAYEVDVKHRLTLGGSGGTLQIYSDRVVYRSESDRHSRVWTYDQIEAFDFTSAREFELVTAEKQLGGPTRTFRFQLKEALPESSYDYLWVRVHRSKYDSFKRRPFEQHAPDRRSISKN